MTKDTPAPSAFFSTGLAPNNPPVERAAIHNELSYYNCGGFRLPVGAASFFSPSLFAVKLPKRPPPADKDG